MYFSAFFYFYFAFYYISIYMFTVHPTATTVLQYQHPSMNNQLEISKIS
jgi:hypothetical protein